MVNPSRFVDDRYYRDDSLHPCQLTRAGAQGRCLGLCGRRGVKDLDQGLLGLLGLLVVAYLLFEMRDDHCLTKP